MSASVSLDLLEEMKRYYRERASEYDECFFRQGRYDRGPQMNARWFAEFGEVFAALDAFHLAGEVLELAAGTGIWTEGLIRTASTVTAVDASPEMLAINRAKVCSPRVWYVLADLFSWHPERVYDAIFFGFWLSHVPQERLDDFLRSCTSMLDLLSPCAKPRPISSMALGPVLQAKSTAKTFHRGDVSSWTPYLH
jgi:2-polyprenyl-3-methyl-5-hydroxy-6-metoxy-1,4-benzoquinol methylase